MEGGRASTHHQWEGEAKEGAVINVFLHYLIFLLIDKAPVST
jgi:hypothetical protein